MNHRRDASDPQQWDAMAYVADLEPLLRDTVNAFLHGICYPMALALHRLTGLDLVVLFDESDGASLHAMVRHPSGALLDAAGWRDEDEVCDIYDASDPVFVQMAESDLRRYSELLSDDSIVEAAKRLLHRLPNHPWRTCVPAQDAA